MLSEAGEVESAQRWKEHADVVGGDFFTQKYVPKSSKIRVVFGSPFLKSSKPTFSASTKTQCKYDDVIYQLIVACLRPPRPSMQRGPCSLVLHLCVNIEFIHTIQESYDETDPEFYQCPALTFLGSPGPCTHHVPSVVLVHHLHEFGPFRDSKKTIHFPEKIWTYGRNFINTLSQFGDLI